MKHLFLFIATVFSISVFAEVVSLETPNTQLILDVEQGGDAKILYYGSKSVSQQELMDADMASFSVLPAYGSVDMIHLPALQVQHADGDLNLELAVEKHSLRQDDRSQTLTISMKDKKQPFFIDIFYKVWREVDIIETWTEFRHQEKKAVVLKRFDSGHLFFGSEAQAYLTHLHGDWAAEAVPTTEQITAGVKTIRNTDGARNAHLDAPEVMLSLDGKPQENSGCVVGAALCWSGNYEIRVSRDNNRNIHLYAGIDPQSSEYVLEPKEVFVTPHLAFTFSSEGMGGVSRSFHRWARQCGIMHNGSGTRDILLNSWEGIYFDITEQRIIDMMDDIAAFGGELFVMDDGWFGGKYQRNTDNAALGDWVVDKRKLPNGLKALTDAARERKIKFGIWIEPESTNTLSELYENHPDWVLQTKGRELKLGRGGTQLVLDLTNPKVQDYIYEVVDKLLAENPEIAYIKWDANASIQNYGSLYLPADKQNNLSIDYHRGLLKVLKRIRSKYPDVVIQNCASGGGRANYGLMPYFDEFWVSDNNDALQRIYIQWGTSYFFPSNAMAQHIGGSPYHMTGRVVPVKFRCDVAMSGRLGMELQPRNMTDEERKQCTTAINDYKEMREVIQLGNLYRLVSPYENVQEPLYQCMAALMFVSDNKNEAVVFAYSLSNYMYQTTRRVRFAGLDADAKYIVKEMNVKEGAEPCSLDGKKFSGAFLMTVGLDLELKGDYASRVLRLIRNLEFRDIEKW